MATLVHRVIDGYNDLMENKSDPRVNNWFMMSGPFPTLCVCVVYAYCSKVLGPKLMANRKPFELRRTLLVYNLIQVFISAYLFYESLATGWGTTYSYRCQPVDYSNSPIAVRMARGCYLYYLSKFSELFDTLFFVLRKKNNQITTLHVIHHGIMPLSVWFGVKFTPGGHSSFFGMLNTFVHIWMYAYYFLAALGPAVQPYLWWKRYLTSMQIIQFVLVMIHSGQLLFIDCDYPKAFVWWIGMHAVLFFFLFRDFYNTSYNKKQERKALKEREMEETRRNKEASLTNNSSEQNARKRRENGTGKDKSSIYADDYKVATGYISDEGLRNRVFIDKNGGFERS